MCLSMTTEILCDLAGAVDGDGAEATGNESRRTFIVGILDAPRGNGPTVLERLGGELGSVRPRLALGDGTAGSSDSRLLASVVGSVGDRGYENANDGDELSK